MKFNPYKILGVKADATVSDIRIAFNKKAKKLHPDAGGDQEKFCEARKAYDILTDEESRAFFDQTGMVEGDPEHALMADACNNLQAIFFELITSCPPESLIYIDIIAMIREAVVKKRPEFEEQITKAKEMLQKQKSLMEMLEKRMKKKAGEGDNIFIEGFRRSLASIPMQITNLEGHLRINDKMMEILKEYNFDKARKQTSQVMFSPMMFSTTATSATGQW